MFLWSEKSIVWTPIEHGKRMNLPIGESGSVYANPNDGARLVVINVQNKYAGSKIYDCFILLLIWEIMNAFDV